MVGTLREVDEVETNDDGPQAQPARQRTRDGQRPARQGGDVDQFAVDADAGPDARRRARGPRGARLAGRCDPASGRRGGLRLPAESRCRLASTRCWHSPRPRSGTLAVRVFGFPVGSELDHRLLRQCEVRLPADADHRAFHRPLPAAGGRARQAGKAELFGWNLPAALSPALADTTTSDVDRLVGVCSRRGGAWPRWPSSIVLRSWSRNRTRSIIRSMSSCR